MKPVVEPPLRFGAQPQLDADELKAFRAWRLSSTTLAPVVQSAEDHIARYTTVVTTETVEELNTRLCRILDEKNALLMIVPVTPETRARAGDNLRLQLDIENLGFNHDNPVHVLVVASKGDSEDSNYELFERLSLRMMERAIAEKAKEA